MRKQELKHDGISALWQKIRLRPMQPCFGAALAFGPVELVEQMLEVRRGDHHLRLEVLLQPLAHRIADRPAGLAGDGLAVLDFEGRHGSSVLAFVALKSRYCNSGLPKMFPGPRRAAWG